LYDKFLLNAFNNFNLNLLIYLLFIGLLIPYGMILQKSGHVDFLLPVDLIRVVVTIVMY